MSLVQPVQPVHPANSVHSVKLTRPTYSGKKLLLAAGAFAGLAALAFQKSREFSFFGKSVMIAGGSRGLGLALAENLVRRGAHVTLLARDTDELTRAEGYLLNVAPDAQVTLIECDVTEREQLNLAISTFKTSGQTLDVYIHNAGLISVGPLESQTSADFQRSLDLHLFAPLHAIQLLTPIFKNQGGGRIVNICSLGGKIPVPHLSAYCAGKYALSALSQSARIELRPYGIKVTTVYPGLMRTGSPINADFKGDHDKEFGWFSIGDSMPVMSIPADTAARVILNGIARGKSEIVISAAAKFGSLMHSVAPRFTNSVLSLVNRGLPQGHSQRAVSGARSQAWIDAQGWTAPLKQVRETAEQRYNQT